MFAAVASGTEPDFIRLSVVIPVCNEAGNVEPLAAEIMQALTHLQPYEIIFVDDGSTDDTAERVRRLKELHPVVRLLRTSRRSGQSAAVRSGVHAARAEWIATLDGDGQNDPADIPALLQAHVNAADPRLGLVIGHRTTRRDNSLRRWSSRIANGVRGRLLHDGTPDTGCGLKVFRRATFLELPYFDHMHRFLPALVQRTGRRVLSLPVRHRPRGAGRSKYGVRNRLWVGIVDLFGVMWLIRRHPRRDVDVSEAR